MVPAFCNRVLLAMDRHGRVYGTVPIMVERAASTIGVSTSVADNFRLARYQHRLGGIDPIGSNVSSIAPDVGAFPVGAETGALDRPRPSQPAPSPIRAASPDGSLSVRWLPASRIGHWVTSANAAELRHVHWAHATQARRAAYLVQVRHRRAPVCHRFASGRCRSDSVRHRFASRQSRSVPAGLWQTAPHAQSGYAMASAPSPFPSVH